MMLLWVGAIYLVIGAIFATIIVPLLALASVATALFGLVWMLI
jgi:hypothetical protein